MSTPFVEDSQFVEKTFLYSLNFLGILVENQLIINVWVYFWSLGSISLIYMSTFMPVSQSLVNSRFIISFKSEKSPNFVLF